MKHKKSLGSFSSKLGVPRKRPKKKRKEKKISTRCFVGGKEQIK
jgi:hypothetical protein